MSKKVIDLSLEIYHQAPTFAPDPKCGIVAHHTIETFGYNITRVTMSTHQGTHLDAPYHFFDKGLTVDNLDLNKCVGPAIVIDLSYKKAKEEILPEGLSACAEKINEASRILIRTDWDKKYPKQEYFSDQPVITPALARWLAKKKIALLGLETPGVHPIKYEEVHKILLAEEIVIVEALANLRQLTKDEVFFAAVPLKFKGRDGSPVRAFAIEESSHLA